MAQQADVPGMERPSVRLLLTLALAMAISGAAGAFAAGGRFQADAPGSSTCEVPADRGPCREDGGGAESDAGDTKGARDETTPEEREAACGEAAGYEGDADGDTEPTDEPEKVTGLSKAIERVYANCVRNPGTPGLVKALEHLNANAERQETRGAEHEARAAERAAEKAERDAQREARKTEHGGGNPHTDGEHPGNGKGGNPHD